MDQPPRSAPTATPDPLAGRAHGWAAMVEDIADALRGLYGPCETSFLAIGEQLAAANGTLRAMGDTAGRLAEMFNADWLVTTVRRLDKDLGALNRLLAVEGEQTGGLDRINEAAMGIDAALEALHKVISRVRTLAINAKVEASQLTGMNVDFGVFTREIGRLAQRGEETVKDIRAALTALRAVLRRAITVQNAFQDEHRKELDVISVRLGSAVESLHQRQSMAEEAMASLEAALGECRRMVSDVVSALQIGDMTRQRVEHVEHALHTVTAVLVQSGEGQQMGSVQRQVFINAICDLQSRQLRTIGAGFDAQAEAIDANLRALGQQAQAFLDIVTGIHASGGRRGEPFLQALEKDLDRTEGILEEYNQARKETAAILEQVGQTAEEMGKTLGAIHDIDAEMHLIGLNASIKCGNMGAHGRALKVVAGELQGMARQTRGVAADIGRHLTVITTAAATLNVSGATSGAQDDQGMIVHLEKVLRESIQALEQVGEGTARDMTGLHDLAAGLVRANTETLHRFTIRIRLSHVLSSAARDLERIAMGCRPAMEDEAIEQARSELLSFLHEHYTMVSERDVHAAMLSGAATDGELPAAMPPTLSAAGGGEPDISDLLF